MLIILEMVIRMQKVIFLKLVYYFYYSHCNLTNNVFVESVGNHTKIRDKVNLEYICGYKPYLSNRFYKVELSLKSTF